jgi:predicted nucleic acid-binding protein
VIVVDASALFASVGERGSSGAVARIRLAQEELHAPHLVDLEVAEATRGRLLRGLMTVEQAAWAIEALGLLPMVRHGHTALLPRISSLRDNLTSYDACYVALAEQLGAVLVTADRRLANAPGPRCRVDVLG